VGGKKVPVAYLPILGSVLSLQLVSRSFLEPVIDGPGPENNKSKKTITSLYMYMFMKPEDGNLHRPPKKMLNDNKNDNEV